MPATWRAATAGIDLLTAVCAAVNLVYFCYRLSAHPPETASRRAAAVVVGVVSFATVVEGVALLAAAAGGGEPLGSPAWGAVRGLALAGALGMAPIILRKALAR